MAEDQRVPGRAAAVVEEAVLLTGGGVELCSIPRVNHLPGEDARSSVRFSLGPGNTAEQVDALVGAIAESVGHLRRISPQVVHAE